MQLVSFSVTDYRSITAAYKLPFRQSTVLIGPNNEGKSNILKALVTALGFLGSLDRFRLFKGRLRTLSRDVGGYDWTKDFPISHQERWPDGESIFGLEFKLSPQEVIEFAAEVKSNLNGNLPIQLTFGKGDPGFKVLKKGPGGPALSSKRQAIAQFISKRINLTYIPAIRTSLEAHNIVANIVDQQLAVVEVQQAYKDALTEVAKLQEPVLNELSSKIKDTLKEFLPNVKDVKVTISEDARHRALRREYEIVVDDGSPTLLERKGDGVQSLAALSLMRQSFDAGPSGKQLILAIEEPESHLHPKAIHQLKGVIADIATQHQVVMTTHCPLFVDRTSIKSNILVRDNMALPAKNIQQIREILGIRAADNLRNAELILVVEGEDDRRVLLALLRSHSSLMSSSFDQGALAIESLFGGSNLSYKLGQIRETMCLYHCYLDHDKAGLDAFNKAEQDGLITLADANFCTCDGMKEAELEDIYDESLYSEMIQRRYGVSTLSPKFKGNDKWSNRLRETFKHQGKPWSEQIEAQVKAGIVELVEANTVTALNAHKRSSFDALVKVLEGKIERISTSKA
jgi:putative ATP-dependent endonuclease of the OLD family